MGEMQMLQGKAFSVGLLLLVFINHAFSQSNWVSIDCGAETSYTDSNGIEWKTDEEYTKIGQNKQVTVNGLNVSEQMDTLRFFRDINKNCYSIPTPDKVKYLVRAGFFYGNYDGLEKPPVFELIFDVNKWVTVTTSIDEPAFYEMIYATTGDTIDICVARTSNDQLPFISSLEVMPFEENMYEKMNRNYAWFLNYRSHFGDDAIIGYPDDEYNRIWTPFSTPSLSPVEANFTELTNNCPDDPPSSMMLHAVQTEDSNISISLQFDFPQTSRINYLALYFTEVIQLSEGDIRSFSISIDGHDYGPIVSPQFQICEEVNITTNSASGTMNMTISPTDDSTLPPLLSAAEVFTVSATLARGTDQDDVSGLQTIMQTFSGLQAWSGDPCLPSKTEWEWLGCNTDDPPRVVLLSLSGYGLEGEIPDFSQLQALETINMDHNGLTGQIPDFLGNLPNLKLLNLSYNNLDGEVPSSLNHSKIIYDVTHNGDNPNPEPPGGNNDDPPAGSKNNSLEALWSLVSLVLIGIGIWWCCRRRRDIVVVESAHNTTVVEVEHVQHTTFTAGQH